MVCVREREERAEKGGKERVVFSNIILEVAHQRVPYFHTVFTQSTLRQQAEGSQAHCQGPSSSLHAEVSNCSGLLSLVPAVFSLNNEPCPCLPFLGFSVAPEISGPSQHLKPGGPSNPLL